MTEAALASLIDRHAPAPAPAPRRRVLRCAPGATAYDFRGAVHLSPDQMRSLTHRASGLAAIVSRTLQAYLDADVSFGLQSVETAPYEQYVAGLPEDLVAGVVGFGGGLPAGIWEVPPPLAFAAIDCMLGGRGTVVYDGAHDLTPVQCAVLSRFLNDILAAWAVAWEDLAALTPRIERVITSAAVAVATGRVDAQTIHIRFHARIAAAEGVMNVALPITVMQRILQETRGDNRGHESAREQLGQAPLGGHARRCPCAVRVVLPAPPITLRHLLSLQPGDTLDLQCPADEPFVMMIGNRAKFAATPGISRGLIAARIECALPS